MDLPVLMHIHKDLTIKTPIICFALTLALAGCSSSNDGGDFGTLPVNPGNTANPLAQVPTNDQPVSQTVNQPVSQPVNQPVSQPVSQPVNQPASTGFPDTFYNGTSISTAHSAWVCDSGMFMVFLADSTGMQIIEETVYNYTFTISGDSIQVSYADGDYLQFNNVSFYSTEQFTANVSYREEVTPVTCDQVSISVSTG